MSSAFLFGLLAALFATLSWALNFISPYVTGPYGNYDFIVARFFVAGAIGAILVVRYRQDLRSIGLLKILFSMCMGVLGYFLYTASVIGGVYFSGPVMAPAVIGTVPIFMLLIGNIVQKSVQWRKLASPLLLTFLGLSLINFNLLAGSVDISGDRIIGFLFCIAGVGCWISFSILNQKVTEKIPSISMGAHTGLMMLGAGLVALMFAPLGMWLGLIDPVPAGVNASGFVWFLVWAVILAFLSSVGGAWAWNYATQNLPMLLTGQLISVETLFATVFGLLASQRLPTWFEAFGTVLVILGVIITVRTVMKPIEKRTTMCVDG